MFAIIEIAGHQFQVKTGDKITTEKVIGDIGSKIKIENVLAIFDEGGKNMKIGTPHLTNHTIEAKIIDQGRDDKIKVVKFHRRKRYTKIAGHRQLNSRLEIVKI